MAQSPPGQKTIPVDLSQDSHIHTRLCNHATGDMEDYVRAALGKGLRTIIFLEHLELETRYAERTWLTDKDFSFYFTEGKRLQEKYRNRLAIKLGVEVGFNPMAIDALQKKIARYPWEHIGLSYHYYYTGKEHLNMVSRRRINIDRLAALGTDKVITDYFTGLIQGIESLACNSICHLDAVMRHCPGLRFNDLHLQQIDRILELIRQKNMQLEINTSGFALRGEPYPGRSILKKAINSNISLLAGSDAHHPDQVARYFDCLPELLARSG